MHFTLHLTNDCNMACKYCYVNCKKVQSMTIDTARKAVDLASNTSSGSAGIIFFGGEPLLERNTIYETVEYCKYKEKQSNCLFHYKITTNGTLLDKEFIEFAAKENVFIALSHDGIEQAHNTNRVEKSGNGTFDKLSDKIDLLLSAHPYAPVMMVVDSSTVQHYYDSVEYLFKRGFKYLICSLNYNGNWSEDTLQILKSEYEKLAEFYMERTLAEDKFYLSPFEVKISSHIQGDNYCHERCELGLKQISISPDGKFYPCVQFVRDDDYVIGDVNKGLDEYKKHKIYLDNEEEKASCRKCAIRKRCNHYCGCLNKQTTGSINKVSPVLCAHERILMPIADKLAGKLYKKRSGMFIQKHYNDMYPLISFIEDAEKVKD